MKANGRDRVVAGRQFERPLLPRDVPQTNRAVAAAGGERLAIGREARPSAPNRRALRAASLRSGLSHVPNEDAMVVGRGGNRAAVGRDRRRRSRRPADARPASPLDHARRVENCRLGRGREIAANKPTPAPQRMRSRRIVCSRAMLALPQRGPEVLADRETTTLRNVSTGAVDSPKVNSLRGLRAAS